MAFVDFFNTLSDNLGVSYPDVVLLGILLTSLIFWAVDLRIGVSVMFLLTGIFYVLFELLGLDSSKFLLFTALSFVVMCLSLYLSHKRGTGGII